MVPKRHLGRYLTRQRTEGLIDSFGATHAEPARVAPRLPLELHSHRVAALVKDDRVPRQPPLHGARGHPALADLRVKPGTGSPASQAGARIVYTVMRVGSVAPAVLARVAR